MEQSEEIPNGLACTDPDCMAKPHWRGAVGCVDERFIGPDPETVDEIDPGDAARIIRESNDVRVQQLEAKSGGQVSLENAFDALKMIALLENLCAHLGITETAMLDFEGRRAEMLSKIEHQYEQMLAAREAARRQQVLSGGVGQQVPPPGAAGPRIVRGR